MDISDFKLRTVIEEVGKEKNISKETLISALEAAMLSAAKKKLGVDADLEAKYNEDIGEIEVFKFRQIVNNVITPDTQIEFEKAKKLDPNLKLEAIGEDLGIKLDTSDFGRIAAQNARQIIIQRVRDAECSMIFKEYKNRKNELITGTVRRLERGNIFIDLGRAEAILPIKEQVSKENIRVGDRIIAYVLDVLEFTKGAQIILSRTNPNFIIKLFEQEVPEIEDGIISIKNVSREPGERSKISVYSKDNDVDPVGACVGVRGCRVQSVVQELKDEKIDIVPYDEDSATFVCNALAPAEITRVLINESEHKMQIVVPDEQISLAIGKRGQNVRLAAELTNWKIDINSESKVAQERDVAFIEFESIKILNKLQIQTLYNHGLKMLSELSTLDADFLASLPGFEKNKVKNIINIAKLKCEEEKKQQIKLKQRSKQEAKDLLLTERLNKNPKLFIKNLTILTNTEKSTLLSKGYNTLIDICFDKDNIEFHNDLKLSFEKINQLKLLTKKLLENLK